MKTTLSLTRVKCPEPMTEKEFKDMLRAERALFRRLLPKLIKQRLVERCKRFRNFYPRS